MFFLYRLFLKFRFCVDFFDFSVAAPYWDHTTGIKNKAFLRKYLKMENLEFLLLSGALTNFLGKNNIKISCLLSPYWDQMPDQVTE
jgi:hypothetical protein